MNYYIESNNLKFYLNSEVYTPKEDSFGILEVLEEKTKNQQFKIIEIGSGSGIIVISVAESNLNQTHYAVDINFEACITTNKNKKFNGLENIHIICTSLIYPFRANSIPKLIVFNPPYLPEDPRIDKKLTNNEYHQLIGGKNGYETLYLFLNLVRNLNVHIISIISSLSTTPNKLAKMINSEIDILKTIKMGFETLWIIRINFGDNSEC